MRTAVLNASRGICWYLRQATGEAKWDEYLDTCGRQGMEPMSRRDFERQRARHKENNPSSRCC
jgi:hypothetical protein